MQSVTESINNHVDNWIGLVKMSFGLTDSAAVVALMGLIIITGILLFFVVRPIMLMIANRVASQEKSAWLKTAYKQNVFHRISWLIPGIVILVAAPILLNSPLPLAETFANIFLISAEMYLVVILSLVCAALLDTAQVRFLSYKFSYKYSIKSYIQVCKIILFILTAIIMVSILIGRSPLYLLTGLSAMTAVGMLVFRDSILGFVASIQLSAYDIIRIGDWIEMPKFNANGTVVDISLNTMKIQNFDKTVITVPSYAILAESVQNWRGMVESGGRRIKRHIIINVNSMKLCNEALLTRLSQLSLLKKRLDTYLQTKDFYIDQDAAHLMGTDKNCLSNLTLFRLYLEAYLASHPRINADMSFLVRELQNNKYGIPIEIYVFANETNWQQYEAIQSSLFDYLYSILPLFELEAYQYSSETKKGFTAGTI